MFPRFANQLRSVWVSVGCCRVKEIEASQRLQFGEEDLLVTPHKDSFPMLAGALLGAFVNVTGERKAGQREMACTLGIWEL